MLQDSIKRAVEGGVLVSNGTDRSEQVGNFNVDCGCHCGRCEIAQIIFL